MNTSMNNRHLEETETKLKSAEDLPRSSRDEYSETNHGVSSSRGGIKNPHQPIQVPMDTAANAYEETVERKKYRKNTTFEERLKEKMEEGRKGGGRASEQKQRSKLESRGNDSQDDDKPIGTTEHKNTTFEERLKEKMEEGRKGDCGASEQRQRSKLESRGNDSQDDDKPIGTTEHKNTTFEERLKEKMDEGRKGDGRASEQRQRSKLESRGDDPQDDDKPSEKTTEHTLCAEDLSVEPLDDSLCREGVQATDMEAQVQVQPMVSDEGLITATLVEEGEVAVAVPVGFCARRWKLLALAGCILLTLLAAFLSLTLMNVITIRGENMFEYSGRFQPTSSPTFDPSPTLEIIQSRGHVRCGMSSSGGFYLDLCQSVAAVVVGSSEKYEIVPVTTRNRWQQLNDRNVDMLVRGDTHTIEREIREGLSFSSPYNYDGMVYFGNQTFVRCAEEYKRYDECSSIKICATVSSTHYNFLKASFASDYLVVGSSRDEVMAMLLNGTCNVAANDKSYFLDVALSSGSNDRGYVLGQTMMTKEPLAIVTRNNDREFSDVVNWVLQALFHGEEQGLTKNVSLCLNYSNLTLYDATDLPFLNSVYCVGNYGDIFGSDSNDRGMNQINNGSTGMLYAIPFGNLDKDNTISLASGSTLAKIRKEGFIKCGVVVPNSFEGNVTGSNKLIGMSVDYCQTLSAALFTGDSKDVNFLTFPETDNSSFIALANGTIDVLVGGRVQRKYDFRSPSLEGFHFSTPYYYRNEVASNDVSFYSIATRDHEDDVLFSTFVNCIVLATIYAQENRIQREKSRDMILVFEFGNELNWAMKDAIFYSGSYDEMYMKNFDRSEEDRGRNILNKGGPMMHSFPHLSTLTL